MKKLSLEQRIEINSKIALAVETGCKDTIRIVENKVRGYVKVGYDMREQISALNNFNNIIANGVQPICKYNIPVEPVKDYGFYNIGSYNEKTTKKIH